MDVDDEWELLSDEGFLEISDDAGSGNQIYSRNSSPAAAAVFHTNYFICPSPSPPPPQFVETTASNRILADRCRDRRVQINIESFSTGGSPAADPDPFSQVFFKKMKEAEFVDMMKVDSPKSSTKFEPNFQFEPPEKGDPCKFDAVEMAIEKEKDGDDAWKWNLSGIGAICSFGVAAATFCIIVFTNNKHPHRNNRRLHFRIYTDDKRMKVKGAIAAVSGVPINRARITVGGYYDHDAAAAAAV